MICAACGVRTRNPSLSRCRCGASELWFPADALELEPRARAVRGDTPLESDEQTSYLKTGLIDDLFGSRGLPCPSSILFYGAAGSGKTRAVLQLVTRISPALLVHLEYPRGDAIRSAGEIGISLDECWFLPALAGWDEEATATGARLVIIDSISACARPISLLRSMAEWSRRSQGIAVGIAHANKRGRVSGSTALEHWPDVVIVARGGPSSTVELSTPRKNRHGMTGPGAPRVRLSLVRNL